jgi:1-acyl-sn-glycerol-3-phosphate acyltransferase
LIRNVLVGITAAVTIVALGPVGLLTAWASGSSRPLFVLSSAGIRAILWVGGVRLVVSGRDRLDADTAYVFLANHVSNLDPPVAYLATDRDVRTLAKAEVFRIPVFGKVLKMAGFPAVHRGDRTKAIAALSAAAEVLADGHDFMAFPEGTRSPSGELGEFKKGPFIMALQAGAPIAPMVLRGTGEVWPKGTMRLQAGTVEIEFLDPVPTVELTVDDRDSLRHSVRAAMAEALATGAPVLH